MLLFVDSMSHYTDSFLTAKWDVREVAAGFGGSVVQSLTSGRFGGGGITFVTPTSGLLNDHGYYIQKNYNGVSTIICGLAVLQTTTQVVRGGRLVTFLDGSTTQVAINILQSGQLAAYRATTAGTGFILAPSGSSPQITTLGTSVSAIASSSYDFLEIKVVHHPTTGSIEVKRNGAAFWTLSNVNTAISGTNQSASVIVGGYTSLNGGVGANLALQAVISDFHLLNTTANGSDPNDPVNFIGDRHWEVVAPTTDSTPLDWTITGSASHFANVDEIPPNTTDYNSTSVLNDQDALLYTDITGPAAATVLLSYTMYLEKDTGGAVGVSGLMVSPAGGAGTIGNGTEFQVPNPFAFRQSFLCTDPAAPGTDALTVATVNAGAHGYERTS